MRGHIAYNAAVLYEEPFKWHLYKLDVDGEDSRLHGKALVRWKKMWSTLSNTHKSKLKRTLLMSKYHLHPS